MLAHSRLEDGRGRKYAAIALRHDLLHFIHRDTFTHMRLAEGNESPGTFGRNLFLYCFED